MNSREKDDECPWCGSPLVWRGSLMDGGLVCEECEIAAELNEDDMGAMQMPPVEK